MSDTNNQNKEKRVKAGAVWVRTVKDKKEKWLSLEIEINGTKYNYVGFVNSFKQPGDNKPSYNLFEAKPRPAAATQASTPVPAQTTAKPVEVAVQEDDNLV